MSYVIEPPLKERTDEELLSIIYNAENWQEGVIDEAKAILIKRGFDRRELSERIKEGVELQEMEAVEKGTASYSYFEMLLMILFWPIAIYLARHVPGMTENYDNSYKRKNNQVTACMFIGVVVWILFFTYWNNRK